MRVTHITLSVAIGLMVFSLRASAAETNVGYSPGWDQKDGERLKPGEIFSGREIKSYHFFFQKPSTRALWSFLTEPITAVLHSETDLFVTTCPLSPTAFSPYAVVVFDDFSTASIETSDSDWIRISYLRKAYYAKKAGFAPTGAQAGPRPIGK